MNKIKNILIRTILPATIGAIVLVGYFLVDDRLTPRSNVESCEDFYLSNSDYLIFFVIIAGLGSIFKFATDKILFKKLEKTAVLRHIVSVLLFAFFFLLIFLIATTINGKLPDIIVEVILILLVLGTIVKILSLAFERLFVLKTDK